jgi:hypothetical protein
VITKLTTSTIEKKIAIIPDVPSTAHMKEFVSATITPQAISQTPTSYAAVN